MSFSALFNVVFESLYRCVNAIFNPGKTSSSFFSCHICIFNCKILHCSIVYHFYCLHLFVWEVAEKTDSALFLQIINPKTFFGCICKWIRWYWSHHELYKKKVSYLKKFGMSMFLHKVKNLGNLENSYAIAWRLFGSVFIIKMTMFYQQENINGRFYGSVKGSSIISIIIIFICMS